MIMFLLVFVTFFSFAALQKSHIALSIMILCSLVHAKSTIYLEEKVKGKGIVKIEMLMFKLIYYTKGSMIIN